MLSILVLNATELLRNSWTSLSSANKRLLPILSGTEVKGLPNTMQWSSQECGSVIVLPCYHGIMYISVISVRFTWFSISQQSSLPSQYNVNKTHPILCFYRLSVRQNFTTWWKMWKLYNLTSWWKMWNVKNFTTWHLDGNVKNFTTWQLDAKCEMKGSPNFFTFAATALAAAASPVSWITIIWRFI